MAEFLLGPVGSVFALLTTVHRTRPDNSTGESRVVENEDIAQVLMKFARGCPGTMEISRIATGKKCGLSFEICGTRGSLIFDQERMNELRYYSTSEPAGRSGFRTIPSGPDHPDYAAFCPAPGHGLGINDLKVIEIKNLILGISHNETINTNFRHGYRVQTLIDAIEMSHLQKQWIDVSSAAL